MAQPEHPEHPQEDLPCFFRRINDLQISATVKIRRMTIKTVERFGNSSFNIKITPFITPSAGTDLCDVKC